MQNSNNSLLRLAERIYDLDAKVYESLGSSLGRVFNGDRERCINDIVERLRERNEGHTLRSELALISNMARTIREKPVRSHFESSGRTPYQFRRGGCSGCQTCETEYFDTAVRGKGPYDHLYRTNIWMWRK